MAAAVCPDAGVPADGGQHLGARQMDAPFMYVRHVWCPLMYCAQPDSPNECAVPLWLLKCYLTVLADDLSSFIPPRESASLPFGRDSKRC